MNLEKKTWEEMRKIPHKEEVDPKVEVDGFGTPKNTFFHSRFAPSNSNSAAMWRKRWAQPILNKKNRFSETGHDFIH